MTDWKHSKQKIAIFMQLIETFNLDFYLSAFYFCQIVHSLVHIRAEKLEEKKLHLILRMKNFID